MKYINQKSNIEKFTQPYEIWVIDNFLQDQHIDKIHEFLKSENLTIGDL